MKKEKEGTENTNTQVLVTDTCCGYGDFSYLLTFFLLSRKINCIVFESLLIYKVLRWAAAPWTDTGAHRRRVWCLCRRDVTQA